VCWNDLCTWLFVYSSVRKTAEVFIEGSKTIISDSVKYETRAALGAQKVREGYEVCRTILSHSFLLVHSFSFIHSHSFFLIHSFSFILSHSFFLIHSFSFIRSRSHFVERPA
jgi:hypothetical protein